MEPLIALVLAVGTLLVGLALGWTLAGRSAAPLRSEVETLRTRNGEVERELAARAEREKAAEARAAAAELLRPMLTAVTEEREAALQTVAALSPAAERCTTLEAEIATLRADKEALSNATAAYERGEAERAQAHAAQLAQLKELEAKVEARFADLAAKAVDGAHEKFLKQAAERFGHAEKQSEEKIKALLQPVESTLKRYDEKLDQIEKARNASYGELQAAVKLLHDGHSQVRDETRNLVNALRSSPKARGRWGEQSLKNVLEQAGLSQFADFETEVSVDTEDGRLRPDVIVRLPGGRKLIIDAKCSLNAFLDANEASDEDSRKGHLKAHAAAIRNHAQQLGSKNYWDRFGDAADYVVMYIPGEHFLTAALEQDDGLWEWAFERRVLLATPTNLVAIARTVATVWQQEKLAAEAAEIAKLGKELHARLATMGAHVEKVGRNLGLATNAYNAFVGSLESQVMTQAKRFETLGVTVVKEIEVLPVVEASPRSLTKLITAEPVAPAAE